jgi:hypothetical protein
MEDFLLKNGFLYVKDFDEWEKKTFEGKMIVFKRNLISRWILSYEDGDNYLHELKSGSEDDVLLSIKEYERDRKIREILG